MGIDSKPFFTKLPGRGLIHIEGDDRYDFLNKLISNDVKLLEKQNAVYACLLTPQGKFLHDFFMLEGDGFLLLDCEGGARAQDLYKRLDLYRLRDKVQLSVEESNEVYAVFGDESTGIADPRHEGLGRRSFEKPQGLEEKPFEVWDERRIRLGVPDGSRDMVPEKSTLLESNIDKFNGISFEKGCYVGQELTARMHYRGLAKKHLYPVEGKKLPAFGEDITVDGKLAGEMRSSCGTAGLALLKDELVHSLDKADLHVLTPPSPSAA